MAFIISLVSIVALIGAPMIAGTASIMTAPLAVTLATTTVVGAGVNHFITGTITYNKKAELDLHKQAAEIDDKGISTLEKTMEKVIENFLILAPEQNPEKKIEPLAETVTTINKILEKHSNKLEYEDKYSAIFNDMVDEK